MLAYYGTKISPHMTDTPEGYLVCHDVPIIERVTWSTVPESWDWRGTRTGR